LGLADQLAKAVGPVTLASLLEGRLSPLEHVASALLIPLTAHGELLGALLIDAPASRTASDDWKAFAQAIGRQMSLALSLARAFAQVAASEERARALMENAGDAIFVTSEKDVILEINRAGEKLLGLPQSRIVGQHASQFIPEKERALLDSDVGQLQRHMLRADGIHVPIELSATLVEAGGERLKIAIVRDVSERNALAAQLRQAQKMEAIGRLAGGVAHDFNNTLSVVISLSELALSDLSPDDPLAADLAEIKKAGENAADLTRQLLAFSRQQGAERRIVVLNDVVRDMERMLRRLIGVDVELSVALASDLFRIHVDVGLLHQVLLNLVVNARDAMPHGGKLTIETLNTEIGAAGARQRPGLKPGAYVVLRVADTGLGMTEATRARIFEPFFTTKEEGKGTGLGLATVFGIVQQSDGFVAVDSEPGRGTTFEVYLPQTQDRIEEIAPRKLAKARRGSETVLLVDDEDQVRAAVRNILRRDGYEVIEAHNAGEALLSCEKHGGPIHLLLTDVVLPQMSGPELAKRLRESRPALKVLCMSGYTDDRLTRHGLLGSELAFLQKPLTVESLTRKVREVLDSGAAA
jgi:PAS domain S-box-containing protein